MSVESCFGVATVWNGCFHAAFTTGSSGRSRPAGPRFRVDLGESSPCSGLHHNHSGRPARFAFIRANVRSAVLADMKLGYGGLGYPPKENDGPHTCSSPTNEAVVAGRIGAEGVWQVASTGASDGSRFQQGRNGIPRGSAGVLPRSRAARGRSWSRAASLPRTRWWPGGASSTRRVGA
jgi:hypothetical protein